jgi:hypothetical protein
MLRWNCLEQDCWQPKLPFWPLRQIQLLNWLVEIEPEKEGTHLQKAHADTHRSLQQYFQLSSTLVL